MVDKLFLREFMQRRWPDWKPNDTQLDDFYRVLGRCNEETLDYIAFQVATEYTTREPKLSQFRKALVRLQESEKLEQVASQWDISEEDLELYDQERRAMKEWVCDPANRAAVARAVNGLPDWIGDAWSQLPRDPQEWDSFITGLVYAHACKKAI